MFICAVKTLESIPKLENALEMMKIIMPSWLPDIPPEQTNPLFYLSCNSSQATLEHNL
jgi:hypothetical protein